MAYSQDSLWRNRDHFIQGREEIVRFLIAKWERELDYRLVKELWAFSENRIAVRSYGNELWEFDEQGLMRRREASINYVAIQAQHRRLLWSAPGPRPESHIGLGGVE